MVIAHEIEELANVNFRTLTYLILYRSEEY